MISILVPTLGRAKSLEPLAENIASTTPTDKYSLILVLDHDDEESLEAAHCAVGAQHVLCSGTYPQKIAAGYAASGSKPFVLPTADDVVFHEGWFDAFVDAIDDDTHVLGTNDLSPITANGQHATMPIIRRSYIEDPGAAWNETGTIYHLGYHHGWVETETCRLAMHRGVWKFTAKCVIEHRHPDWGTRPVDETDRKGNLANKSRDEALFNARRAEWEGATC